MNHHNKDYPGWRSLLFIPTHIEKFVDRAYTRGADAYILDLEDSVPLAEKESARQSVVAAAKKVTVEGADALVRINLEDAMARCDLVAAIDVSVSAIVIPKVESAGQVLRIAEVVDQAERDKSLPLGHTRLIAMIESVEGLAKLDDIAAASERLVALTLGSEDFSASARMLPTPDTLLYPNQLVMFACRRRGITPLGFPASIADFSDTEKFQNTIKFARQLGFEGAFCIHPKQVEILNQQLTPTADEVDRAQRLIEAYEIGINAGKGAVEFEGKMIDYPVVINSRRLLTSYSQLRLKGRLSR